MNDTLTLGLALLISSALSVGTSLVIRFRFADIIHDEAGLRLLIGQGTWPHKPPRFLAVVFTAIAFVLAWLAAFITPVVFGDELGTGDDIREIVAPCKNRLLAHRIRKN